jgi:hypothetical protein
MCEKNIKIIIRNFTLNRLKNVGLLGYLDQMYSDQVDLDQVDLDQMDLDQMDLD